MDRPLDKANSALICAKGTGHEVNRDRPGDIVKVLMGLEQQGAPHRE